MKIVPDFICIGAQKSGTTWLYHQLQSQPEVSIPYKECNILTNSTFLVDYSEFFSGSADAVLLGDISPFYATQTSAAENLYSANPDAKIIFLLRDPLDRAFSQYRMATNKGNIHHQIPFAKAFQENMQYMKRRGNYLETINEYLSAGFSIDNFLFVNFELIEADPQELMRQVGNFLGISIPSGNNLRTKYGSATHGSKPSEEAVGDVREYYKRVNYGLETYLKWLPNWL